MGLDLKELISVTLVLFSVIDILGNIPVIIDLKNSGNKIESGKATIASAILMISFLFVGELILSLFGSEHAASASVFPVAFPLIAGAGTLTTILTLKAEYHLANIVGGIIINLVIIFIVLRSSNFIQKKLGANGAEILRKIFGIILLAISIKLIKTNLMN